MAPRQHLAAANATVQATPRDAPTKAGRLQSKVAVVTGGASGIGRAVCIAFAREGAKVVVGDTNAGASTGGFDDHRESTTVEAIQRTGADALFVLCDVTDRLQVAALVRAAVDTYGRLDVIVNNAGVFRTGKLTHEFSEEDFDICWAVNVKGTLFGAQEAVKQFLAQGDGGCIVNVVSTSGLQGHPRQSAYNTSKGAQANLTRCLAIDYGSSGIRVNGICPTFVRTQMTRAFIDDSDRFEYIRESFPLKRWGETSDIANAAVFLASDDASFIHGDMLLVDGGETLCRYSV